MSVSGDQMIKLVPGNGTCGDNSHLENLKMSRQHTGWSVSVAPLDCVMLEWRQQDKRPPGAWQSSEQADIFL